MGEIFIKSLHNGNKFDCANHRLPPGGFDALCARVYMNEYTGIYKFADISGQYVSCHGTESIFGDKANFVMLFDVIVALLFHSRWHFFCALHVHGRTYDDPSI